MTNEKKKVLLYSGGMDSFICWWLYEPDVILYIKVGSKYQEKELEYVYRFVSDFNLEEKFEIADLTFLREYELENAHIPLRNLLFIQFASYYGDIIYLCAHKGEMVRDKTRKFRRLTENIINYCLDDILGLETKRKIEVVFPLKNLTKTKLLKKYFENPKSYSRTELKELLEKYTTSCYNETEQACGYCLSCYRRWVAEINNDYHRKYIRNPHDYYLEVIKPSYIKGLRAKAKLLMKKEFYIGLPSNWTALKANKKYLKTI